MKSLLISIPALLIGGAAIAQDAPASAPPAAAAPAPGAETGVGAEVTPEEVNAFASAAIKLDSIAKATDMDDTQKQSAMVAAVQESGLEPQRFNQIGQQAQTDPELQQKVQLAVNQQAGSAAPAPSAEAAPPPSGQ